LYAEIHHFMTGHANSGDQLFFQFKPAVISCDAYAHEMLFIFR